MDVREYLVSLLCVSAAAALIQGFVKGSILKDHVSFLCSLCVLATLVVPSMRLMANIGNAENMVDMILPEIDGEYDDYDEIYQAYLLEGGAERVEEYLVSELAESLGESKKDIDARVTLTALGNGAEVRRVKVFLYPSAYDAEPEAIKKLVYDRLFVDCEIVYLNNNEK